MIIAIDGNEANIGNRVGIGGFAFELLWGFYTREVNEKEICYRIYLKDKPRNDLPAQRTNWQYRVVKPGILWTQIGLPLDLFFNNPKPDVFFSTTHYSPRFSPIPTIVSVMDLSYIHYPYLFRKKDLYQLRNWTAYSVKNASKVITISNSSKNDIINYYKVTTDKVKVIYPGIKSNNKSHNNMDELKNKYRISGEYILFVGTIQPRKNIKRLIEAFSKIILDKTKYNNLKLLIIGKRGWLFDDIIAFPKKLGIESSVIFLDFVPDEDMPKFYNNAICFVLPSLYEGFGLPVLEAMKYGCPVLTSNVSSLPEAGGDAAEYFDPTNVEEITEKIKKLIDSKDKRENMKKKGFEQIKKFSWEKAASETLSIIKELAGNK